jgi:hypothetical protein
MTVYMFLLQASPNLDLSEFLIENQGKRCVVVLDVRVPSSAVGIDRAL